MNIIKDLGGLKKAMFHYEDGLQLEVRVDGKQVALNNDYQLHRESTTGQPDKFVIELSTDGMSFSYSVRLMK
jgi:hypothetical protein